MGNNRFYYSRTYDYREPSGSRRWYMFNLVEDGGDTALFRLIDRGSTQTYPARIEMRGDMEVAWVDYLGRQIFLRADSYHPKGYRLGSNERENDRIKDAYLHTIYNRNEIKESKTVYCVSCRTFVHPSDIVKFTDEGQTGICPYCGKDALIGDGSGIQLSDNLLNNIHHRYFSDNPTIKLTVDGLQGKVPTPCSPYIWIALNHDQSECIGVDASFYSEEEAPEKLKELRDKVGPMLLSTLFEATSCELNGIEGEEAEDAIINAFFKYFEKDKWEKCPFDIKREVDFELTTAWDGETQCFTLRLDSEIEFYVKTD